MGVFLSPPASRLMKSCLPHARGGVSPSRPPGAYTGQSSPRPWGCFLYPQLCRIGDTVFPTPVGVFPKADDEPLDLLSLPHARGGVSSLLRVNAGAQTSSPRPWGCFLPLRISTIEPIVFPTPVGVFLNSCFMVLSPLSLPHARGGVSNFSGVLGQGFWSSPRPWGCFSKGAATVLLEMVFPTPVGVFRFVREIQPR